MRKISITDTTLSNAVSGAELPLSFKEKIEIARHLQNLCVDVIELSGIQNINADTLLIRTITSFVKESVLSVSVGTDVGSIADTFSAVSTAKHPRLRVELPVSAVQMEYVCHKKEPKMLEYIAKMVGECSGVCDDVEFCALDATRADKEFLHQAIKTAISAGATVITICDNDATMMPDCFGEFVSELYKSIDGLKNVKLGVYCDNSFGMALASAMMAIKAGADEIKTVSSGEKLPKLDAFAKIMSNCGDVCKISSGLKHTELKRTVKQIRWIAKEKRSESLQFESVVVTQENKVELNKNDDISTIIRAVKKLGYDLSEEDNAKVFEEFCRAAEKKTVAFRELDAIVASVALQVPPTYKLVSYVINTSNLVTSSAHVRLEKQGKELQGICLGDGPIDSSFLAIEQIVGHHYELDDFQIQSVTEGREAMGSALVKLRNNGKLYSGNGISTDIIGASIAAYLNALNKIIHEEV